MRLAVVLAMTMATGAAAQVTSLEAPGNLAPTVDPGCVTLAGADTRLSPPDLALGVLACVGEGKFDAAADLYALMLLRTAFDVARVADATAHQAGDVLSMQVGQGLSDADRTTLGEALARFGDPAAPQRPALCQAARDAGAPQHDPSWMLQHGMGAFLGGQGDGLVKGFDPDTAWDEILRTDLSCG